MNITPRAPDTIQPYAGNPRHNNHGRIQKRLACLEFLQREQEFKDLEGVLAHYATLSPEEDAAVQQRLIRLFNAELAAGVPLLTSLEKLPEPFKGHIYQYLAESYDREAAARAQTRPYQQKTRPADTTQNPNAPPPAI